MTLLNKTRRLKRELLAKLPDREIYMRTEGRVRYLKISSRFQVNLLVALTSVVAVTLVVLATTAIVSISIAGERDQLSEHADALRDSEKRIQNYRASVAEFADELARRQQRLEKIVKKRFGDVEMKGEPGQPAAALSKLPPEARALAYAEARQQAFAASLTESVQQRIGSTEQALSKVGVRIAGRRSVQPVGVGGPFLPLEGDDGRIDDQIDALSSSLDLLDRLDRVLRATPSELPAQPLRLSSPFGVRADPFNRRRAMHAGLDFRGARGQAIYAAAEGRVVQVGRLGGYGKIVIIRHGQGFETRYGHLSGFDVRPGQRVRAGEQIARMGSTGRSTGNHLHFEVRVNGRAVNPMPYIRNAPYLGRVKREMQSGSGRV